MTKQEKIVVSAYTGVLMCDFADLQEYIEKKFGRPVFTHELADKSVQKEIEEMSKEEFLEICNREEPERKIGKWINHRNDDGYNIADCNQCGNAIQWFDDDETPRYCCMCGANMRGNDNGID